MAIGIVGRKAGMTRVFTEEGVSVPVTVIEVEPNRVTQVCAAGKITPTSVTVTGPDATDPDRRVTVTVEANFRVVTGSILGTFSGTIPLRANATMRHESF